MLRFYTSNLLKGGIMMPTSTTDYAVGIFTTASSNLHICRFYNSSYGLKAGINTLTGNLQTYSDKKMKKNICPI